MIKSKTILFRICSLAFSILLFLQAAAPFANAEESPNQALITLPLFQADQHLTWPKNAVSYWLALPAGAAVSGECVLTLHMKASLTIIEALSSSVVYVNSSPVASRRLGGGSAATAVNPATNAEESCYDIVWEIAFDSALLSADAYNEIRVTTTQRSIEGDCADIDNPSNWVTLQKDSSLKLLYRPAQAPLLRDYYALYYESPANQSAIANDFVLSELNDPALAAAMLDIANAAGMNSRDRAFIRYNVFDKAGYARSENNKIFLDTAESPGGWDALFGGAQPPAQGGANIAISGATSDAPYYKLHVLSGDDGGLRKASALFQNRPLLNALEESELLLQSEVRPVSSQAFIERKASGQYAFSEYGYGDITLGNVFHQQTTLSFAQPGGALRSAGSYIDIRFRHSAPLLPESSMLSVRVNGVPVNSVSLLPENAQGGSLIAAIPESALNEPTINVTLEAYHYLGLVDCSKDYYDVAWTVIDAGNSYIEFMESEKTVTPALSNFPYFYGNGEAKQITFAASDALTGDTLNIASMLAARAGQNTGLAFSWTLLNGSLPSNTAGDIVMLANREHAAAYIPQEITERLALAPTAGGYIIGEAVPLISEALIGKAVIQVMCSPWDANGRIYMILYDGAAGLAALHKLLASRENLGGMGGQVCVAGIEGSVVAQFDYEPATLPPATAESAPSASETFIQRAEAFTGLSAWLMLVILFSVIVLAGAIILLVQRRRNKKR